MTEYGPSPILNIGNNVGGSIVTQTGKRNLAKVRSKGHPSDGDYASMLSIVQALKGQIDAENREILDDALQVAERGSGADRYSLKNALRQILGIAETVGEVGEPAVRAVRGVLESISLLGQ